MKPIIEARAKAAMLEGKNQHSSPSPISDEASPIRTDTAVASLANLGKDTIRKNPPEHETLIRRYCATSQEPRSKFTEKMLRYPTHGYSRLTMNLPEDMRTGHRRKAIGQDCTVANMISKLLEQEIKWSAQKANDAMSALATELTK